MGGCCSRVVVIESCFSCNHTTLGVVIFDIRVVISTVLTCVG